MTRTYSSGYLPNAYLCQQPSGQTEGWFLYLASPGFLSLGPKQTVGKGWIISVGNLGVTALQSVSGNSIGTFSHDKKRKYIMPLQRYTRSEAEPHGPWMNNTRGHQGNSVTRAGMVSPAPLGPGFLDPLLRKVSTIPEWLIGARNEVHLLETLAAPTYAPGLLTSVPSEHNLLICDLRAPHWYHVSYALYPDTSLTYPPPPPRSRLHADPSGETKAVHQGLSPPFPPRS